MQTAKHFVEFLARTMNAIDALDDEKRPKVESVRNYWRCFASEWARRNEIPISEHVKRSITNVRTLPSAGSSSPSSPSSSSPSRWMPARETNVGQYIQGDLRDKLQLSLVKREQGFMTIQIYIVLLKQMWENDWHDYHHDGYRVQWTAALQLFVYTSSRIGEILESAARPGTGDGLRYRVRAALVSGHPGALGLTTRQDILLLVRWRDGEPEIMMAVCRQHTKGMTNTSHKRYVTLPTSGPPADGSRGAGPDTRCTRMPPCSPSTQWPSCSRHRPCERCPQGLQHSGRDPCDHAFRG